MQPGCWVCWPFISRCQKVLQRSESIVRACHLLQKHKHPIDFVVPQVGALTEHCLHLSYPCHMSRVACATSHIKF